MHKRILYEIDALKSLRDRKKKDGRRWCIIHDKIKGLQKKADGMTTNCTWQSAARIVSGADAIISETLHIKGMTTHGWNRKRKMNRSMTHNVRGEFLRKLAQQCERGHSTVGSVGYSTPVRRAMCVVYKTPNHMSRETDSFALIVPKSSTRM